MHMLELQTYYCICSGEEDSDLHKTLVLQHFPCSSHQLSPPMLLGVLLAMLS